MQKEIDQIESQIIERVYNLFQEKYHGNKSAFAKSAQCSETTIRRILRKQQGITINLLLRMAQALDTTVSELMKDLQIQRNQK